MIKIRLSRGGVRNKPFYRIVAVDSKSKNRGKCLELVGHWQPSTGDKVIDKSKIEKWVKLGAQVSPAVGKLLNDILPALKSGVSRPSEDDISVSIHPRNKLRGVLESCYQ